MNRARAMLAGGSPVSVVASDCGFADQSHLTRVFRRALGVPPAYYARAGDRSLASAFVRRRTA
ncbi:Helix-turn-helix domain protein [compost metagenome]